MTQQNLTLEDLDNDIDVFDIGLNVSQNNQINQKGGSNSSFNPNNTNSNPIKK